MLFQALSPKPGQFLNGVDFGRQNLMENGEFSCAPILYSGDSLIDVGFTQVLEFCSAKTYEIAAEQE